VVGCNLVALRELRAPSASGATKSGTEGDVLRLTVDAKLFRRCRRFCSVLEGMGGIKR
jgi:hypothetical protein